MKSLTQLFSYLIDKEIKRVKSPEEKAMLEDSKALLEGAFESKGGGLTEAEVRNVVLKLVPSARPVESCQIINH